MNGTRKEFVLGMLFVVAVSIIFETFRARLDLGAAPWYLVFASIVSFGYCAFYLIEAVVDLKKSMTRYK